MEENTHVAVEADPARPWKAIASAVIAGAAVAIAQGQDVLPGWVLLILAILIGGLTTYQVPNPIVRRTSD